MNTTLINALELYLKDIEPRLNSTSFRHYSKRLRPFIKEHGSRPLSEISASEITNTLARMNHWTDGRDKAPDTVRSNIMGWEQLQSWLVDNDILSAPITPKKFMKPGGRKREMLPTPAETKVILERTPADFRLIYRALRLTGARPGELCRATIEDIDTVEGVIVLHHHKTAKKTGKPRRIAIGHEALKAIIAEAIGDRTSGPIFIRKSGCAWRTEYISNCFREARKSAGLREGLVLYLARHEHATQLYRKTGDLKTVADALGHTQLNTTMRYTRVESEKLKQNQCLFTE